MYESHWGLSCKPFEDRVDDDAYFPSDPQQGAALKLRYVIENRRGAALLTGVAGTGKSLLARRVLSQLGEQFDPSVQVVFPQFPAGQLIAYLTDELCRITPDATLHRNIRTLENFLTSNAADGRHTVLAIDEAHLLDDPATLEALRLLLNFEHEELRCLTLLLIGQPRVLTLLNRCPGLDDRVAVKTLLRPLNESESVAYVRHRLQAAGCEQEIFDDEALKTMFWESNGIPRKINRICDLALLIGFAEQQSEIGAEQIRAVAEEVVTVRPEAA